MSGRNSTNTYTTISGDTWDKIAENVMGNVYSIDLLMKANMQHIHYFIFPAGIEITIPETGKEDEETYSGLPPWKVNYDELEDVEPEDEDDE